MRHLDGLYLHNEHTLRGDRLHAWSDRPGFEIRKGVRTERGLWIASRRLGLYGRADLLSPGLMAGGGLKRNEPIDFEGPLIV